MWQFLDGQVLPVQVKMEDTLAEYRANFRNKQVEVALRIFFFALCCLGKIPGGAPFSQLHKSGNGGREDKP